MDFEYTVSIALQLSFFCELSTGDYCQELDLLLSCISSLNEDLISIRLLFQTTVSVNLMLGVTCLGLSWNCVWEIGACNSQVILYSLVKSFLILRSEILKKNVLNFCSFYVAIMSYWYIPRILAQF